MSAAPLTLASRSPQRRAILEQVGIAFSVMVPVVEEVAQGDPAAVTVENARRKVAAVSVAVEAADASGGGDRLVLGVDTVVAARGRIFGKPPDVQAARETLMALSGARHTVVSGLCLQRGDEVRTRVERTQVTFRALEERVLAWYLASGEWRERAGGYAIQGRGAALVTGIEGDYLNVVGLPLAALLDLEPSLLA